MKKLFASMAVGLALVGHSAQVISPDQLPLYGGTVKNSDLIMITVLNTNTLKYTTYTLHWSQFLASLTNTVVLTNAGGSLSFNQPFRTNTLTYVGSGSNLSSTLFGMANTVQSNKFIYLDSSGNLNYSIPINAVTTNTVYFTTNNTQAEVQAAMSQRGNSIYFYPGDYYNLTNIAITNGITVTFNQSTFHFAASAHGAMFTVATNATLGLKTMLLGTWTLDGGETATDWRANPKGIPIPPTAFGSTPNQLVGGQTYWSNRSGLYIDLADGGIVQGLTAQGFSGYGVFAFNSLDSVAYTQPQTTFYGLAVRRNFIGLWPAQTTTDYYGNGTVLGLTAHYSTWTGIQASGNTIGVGAGAGNSSLADSDITDNAFGVWMTGNTINGHGNIHDNRINHNQTLELYAYQMNTGEDIHDNEFLAGNPGGLFFDNCVSIWLHHNRFEVQTITFTNLVAANQHGYNYTEQNTYSGVFETGFSLKNYYGLVNTNVYWGNYSYDTVGNSDGAGMFFSSGIPTFTGNASKATNLMSTNVTGTVITSPPTNQIVGWVQIGVAYGGTNVFIPLVITNQ